MASSPDKTYPNLLKHRERVINSILGRKIGKPNRRGRGDVIPVCTTDNNGVLAKIVTGEAKVARAEWAVFFEDILEVADDLGVVANGASGKPADIMAEETGGGPELFEDYRLGFDVTDLLGDDPSSRH